MNRTFSENPEEEVLPDEEPPADLNLDIDSIDYPDLSLPTKKIFCTFDHSQT